MSKNSNILRSLSEYIAANYDAVDYPTIAAQREDFTIRRPLEGLSVLDATPLFFNTSAKYIPLLASGVELTISLYDGVPCDPRFVEWAVSIGISVDRDKSGSYDLISDCIGIHADMNPRLGFAELTHSGISYYADCPKPCFNTDNGLIKNIEGALGTGDGLIRGLRHFGYDVSSGQRWLLFGFGKIGRGVGLKLRSAGADVAVVEAIANRERLRNTPVGDFPFIDMTDIEAIRKAVLEATHIATATSVPGVISKSYPSEAFMQGQLLVNIGAEDEYGEMFTEDMVLNNKTAVNFVLEEPTHLRYIETTFALQNSGLEWVKNNANAHGVVSPPVEMEQSMLEIVRKNGRIADELQIIGL